MPVGKHSPLFLTDHSFTCSFLEGSICISTFWKNQLLITSLPENDTCLTTQRWQHRTWHWTISHQWRVHLGFSKGLTNHLRVQKSPGRHSQLWAAESFQLLCGDLQMRAKRRMNWMDLRVLIHVCGIQLPDGTAGLTSRMAVTLWSYLEPKLPGGKNLQWKLSISVVEAAWDLSTRLGVGDLGSRLRFACF